MAGAASGWGYTDNSRIFGGFLAAAAASLLAGSTARFVGMQDASFLVEFLFAVGTFLAIFATFLFLPRLARRGARSFQLTVFRPIGEVERAARQAIEAMGHTVHVRRLRSRSDHPPRIVSSEGIEWRLRLQVESRRGRRADATPSIEVVQVGKALDDAEAAAVRQELAGRLLGSGETH